MSLNDQSIQQLELDQFQGSMNAVDPYNIDLNHALYSQNIDFIVAPNGNVQCSTRRGTSQIAQIPSADGILRALASWYFSNSGTQDCYAVFYSPASGVRAYDQNAASFTGVLINVTSSTFASFQFDGLRLYAAFTDATSRVGNASAQVYGLGIGADELFAPGITSSVATVGITQPSAGVITAGTHRIGFVFTTRNGYTGILNPVTSASVFAPASFTAADGVHNCQVVITWASIPSYLAGGSCVVQVVMSSAANQSAYYLVPGATGTVPASAGTTTITFSITDGDLTATGTDVTQSQNLLTQSTSGTPPIQPSALFTYSSRMGYVAFDPSGFPCVAFSDQNAYQSLTLAYHFIYIEGRQIPVMGASLGGVCYIATLSGLYATQDNGGLPATWVPPAHVDGSIGILASSCMLESSGRILLASEKGLFLFRGGSFPDIPLSYWQAPDWNRINWTNAAQVQIVDDVFNKTIRVMAPLKVVVTGATNTNPITITTAVIINGNPVALPHLFQTGLSVTITGVTGNTAANTTQNITVTGANTFTIPVSGNGAYTGGGVATPNTPNAIMEWCYVQGDEPGQPFYSINAFTSYRMGAIGLIRNISTNVDETWIAPAASNPGGILRFTLPTDALPYRDQDLSGNPVAINALNETGLVPSIQDRATTLHDYQGAHFRMTGSGSLALTAYGLDHVLSVIPMLSPVTLSQNPGLEVLVRWWLRSEQQSVSFGTNAVDAYFVMAMMRAYYLSSVPIR